MAFLSDQIIAWEYEELNNFSNLQKSPKENSEGKERWIFLSLQNYKLLRKGQRRNSTVGKERLLIIKSWVSDVYLLHLIKKCCVWYYLNYDYA